MISECMSNKNTSFYGCMSQFRASDNSVATRYFIVVQTPGWSLEVYMFMLELNVAVVGILPKQNMNLFTKIIVR